LVVVEPRFRVLFAFGERSLFTVVGEARFDNAVLACDKAC